MRAASGRLGSSYEQTLGQSAGNRQKAGSDARSKQGKAKSKKQAPSHKRGGRHSSTEHEGDREARSGRASLIGQGLESR